MKIQISKSESKFDWYHKKVGQVYDVIKTPDEVGRKLFEPDIYLIKVENRTFVVPEKDVQVVKEGVVEDAKDEKEKSKIRTFIDPNDEKTYIVCHDKGNVVDVSIKLGSEKRKRRIGQITKSTKTIHIERQRMKHLHRQTMAYGFNDFVFRNVTEFQFVDFIDEIARYKFPKQVVIDSGIYLYFKKEGFEKQRFVPLAILEKYKQPKII